MKYIFRPFSILLLITALIFSLLFKPHPQGGIVLIGGAGFPQEAVKWAFDHSNHSYFLVLSYYEADQEYWRKEKLVDYQTKFLTLNSDNIDLPETLKEVGRAGILVFAGGNQFEYIKIFKGSKLAQLINNKIDEGTPVMGTSAGAMALPQFVFSAKYGSVNFEDITNSPELIDIEENLFNLSQLKNIIVDTHYSERHREKRLQKFVNLTNALGIGIDEGTALCIDRQGKTKVYGDGGVHWVKSKKYIKEEFIAKNS